MKADRNDLQLSEPDIQTDIDNLGSSTRYGVAADQSFDFLPGYIPRLSEGLREWVDTRRARVQRAGTEMLVLALEHARLRGDWLSVEEIATKCLSLDPYNESAVLAQAEAAAMRGEKRKAIFILDQYVAEIGGDRPDLRVPAAVLRRRVERFASRPTLIGADPPFVGREEETETLARKLANAKGGKGSGVLVIGEAGIGKSRLSAELGRFAELQGGRVQRVSCSRGDIHRPLSIFVDIVPQLRELPGALGCAPETFSALKRLTEFEQRLGQASLPSDSDALFRNVRAALFDLLDSIAEECCLVIVVDDLQWLDNSSIKLLGEMVDWASTKRVLFLLNSRPVEQGVSDFVEGARLETITLAPLTHEASSALLHSISSQPAPAMEPSLSRWCLAVADGNPFFLQELVHQWMETGHEYEAPPSVAKVLQARIAGLPVEALQVLQTSAVLGDHATLDRVEKVLELPTHRLLSAVEELGRAAMLRSRSDGVGAALGQLQARHDFLSSAATSQLMPQSLAFIHRRCAEVLEREIPEETKPTALLWACTGHRHDAGDRDRALSLSLSCAEHLLGVGLARDSCVAFQKSLEYCATEEQRLGVLPRLAFAFQMNAEWSRSTNILSNCIDLSARVDPSTSSHNDFELLLMYARYQSSLEYPALLKDLMPCVESASASPSHRVRAAVIALKIATDTGPAHLVDSLYQHVVPILDKEDVPDRTREELEIVYQTLRGDALIPVDTLRRLVEAAAKTDGLDYLNTLLTAASACRMSGRYDDGMSFVNEAIEHAKSHRLTNRLAQAYLAAVSLHIAASEFAKADSALREAQRCATSSDDPRAHAEPLFLEARLAIETGDLRRAESVFGQIAAVTPAGTASRKAYFFALAIHIQLMQPHNPGSMKVLVHELQEAHEIIKGIGVQDFESYALFLGLKALGQEREAKGILRDYVYKHRRSRWPLSKEMRAALHLPSTETFDKASTCAAPDESPSHRPSSSDLFQKQRDDATPMLIESQDG